MQDYLIQISYTPEAVARLVKNPENREEVARFLMEKLGGKLKGFWVSFGEYDLVEIATLPDNVSAEALTMVLLAGGAVKMVRTTPLMLVNEGMEAMEKAAKLELEYRPPGK